MNLQNAALQEPNVQKGRVAGSLRLVALLASFALACGGSTTLDGSLDGRFLPVKRSIVGSFAGDGSGTYVVLTADERPCESVQQNLWPPGTTLITFILKEREGADVRDGRRAGTYQVSPDTDAPEGLSARVTVEQFDGTCKRSLPNPSNTVGSSGAVTLDSDIKSGGGASGRYQVSFPGGSSIEGLFAADFCARDASWSSVACGESGNPVTVEVLRRGAGTGTVRSDPSGIECLPTCQASFPAGRVTLTATPSPDGATFEGWSGACTGTSPTCTVVRSAGMDANQTVTATFGQVYTGNFTGSGNITRPMPYGSCTWSSTFSGTARLKIIGWENGVLTGSMRITSQRSEGQGSATDPRQTCLAGGASYDDTQPISGTPSAISWSASPLANSTIFSGSFTGGVDNSTGMLGVTSVSGTITYSSLSPGSGSAVIAVTLRK